MKLRQRRFYGQIRSRGYAGADFSRLTNDWLATLSSEDAEARKSLFTLRNRVRDLCRRDDYAKRFLTLCETNIVGPNGIGLQMDVTDRRVNGDNKSILVPDEIANDLIEDAWKDFSLPENFTVTGQLARQQVEGLVAKTTARDGEYLIRLIRGKAAGNDYNFALQPLEADHLDHELNQKLPNGNQVRMGVEFNVWRKPVAYWLLTEHPGDAFFFSQAGVQRIRVPADEILHGFIPFYFQQSRGIPWFHTAMTRMHQLNGYEEAELCAARAAASKMGFFVRKIGPDGLPPPAYEGDDKDEQGNLVNEMEPGVMEQLPPGVEFQGWNPDHPVTNFPDYRKAVLRGVASGLCVSYNSLAADLEGVNFSSIRAGVLEERDVWMLLQGWLILHFERRIFTEWLKMALLSGALNLPNAKFEKFNKPKFIARRWSYVNPVQEIQAHIAALNAKIKTRGDLIAEGGGDFSDTMRRIQQEKETAAAFGIILEDEITTTAKAPKTVKGPDDDKGKDDEEEEDEDRQLPSVAANRNGSS